MPGRSSVVFLLLDDWGSYDAAFREAQLGRTPTLHTPRIDELASAGVQLARYYVQPICSPTRSALLSGRYQIHTGLQDGIIEAHARVCLPPAFGTMADAFQQLGYSTHMVGKWHVGIYKRECLPWYRGFDTFYGFLTGSEYHYTKIQRIARGTENVSRLYPDFRTHTGPALSDCIAPSTAPLDAGWTCESTSSEYEEMNGQLFSINDSEPSGRMSLSDAQAMCNKRRDCDAFSFRPSAACDEGDCEVYFARSTRQVSATAWWRTRVRCPRVNWQMDPRCYSTHMFTAEATRIIAKSEHALKVRAGAGRTLDGSFKPIFLYLALQAVHEPVEVPLPYERMYSATISDRTRRVYSGLCLSLPQPPASYTALLMRCTAAAREKHRALHPP